MKTNRMDVPAVQTHIYCLDNLHHASHMYHLPGYYIRVNSRADFSTRHVSDQMRGNVEIRSHLQNGYDS